MTDTTTLFYTAPELQFTTDEPGEAQAFMQRAYTERSMRIAGSPESFRMTHSHVDAGSFSLATLTHTMAVEHAADPLGVLLVGHVADGHFHRSTCGEQLLAGRGDTFLVAPPDRPYVCGWDSVRLQLLTLDPAVLDDVAAGDTQQGRSAGVRFIAWTPVSRTAARLCADVIDYLTDHVLGNPAAGDHPLVVD